MQDFFKKESPINYCNSHIINYQQSFNFRSNDELSRSWSVKKAVDDVNKTDAIIALSHILTTIETSKSRDFEWLDPDRFFGGTELIRSDKALLLIFTGERLPWQKINSTKGEVLAKYAKKFRIDPSVIQITKKVQNTEDEVKVITELLTSKNSE